MPDPADFDFPIVELEADSPQAIGKVGLYDMVITVGGTGIKFVAAIAGLLQPWGPVFQPIAIQLANLRAASTLCRWGLISGDIFAFERAAIGLQQSDVATILSVPLLTVQQWESDQIPVPRLAWQEIAARVCKADQVYLPSELTVPVPPASFVARTVRIFPRVPMPPQPNISPPECPPCSEHE
ncbi:MAG: hypothetical protein ACREP9_09595, partial [Candidatus Dormibacteraceae bacterium]